MPEAGKPGRGDLSVVAIIALYNGAEFIERSLRSIFEQTLPATEILVVDDGSTDDGPQIVERLIADRPNAKLLSKENGGQSSARNFGVEHSTSRFIALLDQDDGWYPDHLKKLIKPFARGKHRKLGWVYSDLDRCDRYGRLHERRMLRRGPQEHPKQALVRCLSEDMFILPSASLIDREAFLSVGGFDERLSGYEDDDLFLRMFHAGWENVFLEEPLSYWCIYPTSTSYTPRMAKSRMIYFEKLRDTFAEDPHFEVDPMQDLIVPRFLKYYIPEIARAEKAGNEEGADRLRKQLRYILDHLKWRRRRLMFETYLAIRGTPGLRNLLSTRTLWRLWRLLR